MIWKDFFWFSRTERQGIIILGILLIGVALFRYISVDRPDHEPYDATVFEQEYAAFVASLSEKPEISGSSETITAIRRVPFDPNHVDSVTLLSLGVSQFATRNLLNYRRKGGKFHKPLDVGKIYGLENDLYGALLPYIVLPESVKEITVEVKTEIPEKEGRMKPTTYEKQLKFEEGTILELNHADTTQLKMIPGIGSYIAGRIVSYRNRLGGFYSVDQLEEIGLTPDSLRKWFTVNEELIKKISVNEAGIERLRNHPYLSFYQAKVIVEHRRKRGRLIKSDDLKLYEEFPAASLLLLNYYLDFN